MVKKDTLAMELVIASVLSLNSEVLGFDTLNVQQDIQRLQFF